MVLIAGCASEYSGPTKSFIAPAHDQTSVALDAELRVQVWNLNLPSDYEILPDDYEDWYLRVLDADAEDGEKEVPGRILVTTQGLRFRPDEDWQENRRYIWTLDPLEARPHGPQFALPDNLPGSAQFYTGDDLKFIGAVIEDTEFCLVLSRPVGPEDDAEIRIELDGIPLLDMVLRLMPQEDWGANYVLEEGDEGLDVMCVSTATSFTAGQVVRLYWNDEGTFESQDLEDVSVAEMLTTLRRGGE